MSEQFINNFPLISIITPITIAFIVGLFKNKLIKLKKVLSVLAMAISLLAVLFMIKTVFVNNEVITIWLGNWKPLSGNAYGIGIEVDGLGLFLALIISTASFLSIIYSLRYMENDNGLEKYYVLFLLLTGSMLGFVFTGDLFNMYVMLEIMTFAAVALTAFRNEKYKSVEAAFKYIVTGSLGSSLVLLGTVLIYAETKTLNLAQIAVNIKANGFSPIIILAFSSMMAGYAVKAFMVPCHTWPTDAHMAAPSSISMILSGVMSKTGVYAIIRLVFMIFSLTSFKAIGYLIIVWGVITMVVGVTMALLQHDFKRLLAFHSVSQIGYIISALGIAMIESGQIQNLALSGALYHMINHAVFKGLLFLSAGAVLYITGTTDLNGLSGLGKKMPFTMAMFLFGAAAISGIPPFNGFASKWIIYEAGLNGSCGLVSIIAVVVSAMTLASFIKVGHSVFFGAEKSEYKYINDVPITMKIPMAVLSLATLILGLFPKAIMNYVLKPTIKSILNISQYVEKALGAGYGNSLDKVENIKLSLSGVYSPSNFLILFIILLVAVLALVLLQNRNSSISEDDLNKESAPIDIYENKKYDVFIGGEKNKDIKIQSNDLFWAMKYDLRKYFAFIENAHDGSVNTYSLWIIATLAIVTIISFIFI